MANEMIDLNSEKVVVRAEQPRRVGTKMDLVVNLPKGIVLRSFSLSGVVSDCRLDDSNGSSRYILEMKIGPMQNQEKEILAAYIEFRSRQKALEGMRIDMDSLRNVFSDFGHKLGRLRDTSSQMKSTLEGALELMRLKADGKETIH